jgi:ABC-2 type transport system ATP-binding protein
MEPTIQISDLHKNFSKVKALQGVSLQIERGQIFGLLGPNGAGKTTLIRLLIGAIKRTKGQISILGHDPIHDKRAMRARIGYMPQNPALYDDLSPRQNIRFFGQGHPSNNLEERIEEVITFVGLAERANHPIHTFSGGMRQRVSLACALVNKPAVLFLDEPTSGIDPKLRELFWQHFRQLAEDGATVIVSTHQMDDAMHCDRLAVLHRGKVLACNSPRQFLWESRAVVRIWKNDQVEEHAVLDYPNTLPDLLHSHNLDPDIKRIEIEEEGLEQVMLRLVKNLDEEQKRNEA